MSVATYIRNLNISSLTKLILLLMVFGLFTIDNRGVLNVAAAIMLIVSLYHIWKEKINVIKAIGDFLKNRKLLAIFSLWCLSCIVFFTYKNDISTAFGLFLKDWRYPLVMLLFFIAFNKNILTLRNTYVVSAVFTLSYIVFAVPIIRYIKNDPQALYLQLRYGFAFYIVMLFPFALSSAILIKELYMKVILFFISFSAFIFLLYTGSRGGILSLAVETVVIIFVLSKNIKKFALILFASAIVAGVGLTITYNVFPQVKHKVEQSTNSIKLTSLTSGRDKIISDRYPLVMDSMRNVIFGIGYGNSTYDSYLWDHNAPRDGSVFNKKTNKYNLDEPFFFTILYNVGLGGLILFIALTFVNVKDIIKSIKIEINIFNVSFLASFIGYFLVYCLFEKMFMEIYLLYTIMIFICLVKYNAERRVCNDVI